MPTALLAGIRRRSDEENNYHRAPRHRLTAADENSYSASDNESEFGEESEGEEEEDVEAGIFSNEEGDEESGPLRHLELSNTQSERRHHRKSEDGGDSISSRRSSLQLDGDNNNNNNGLVDDAALYSSNDSAGPPQTMVVVVDGEDGLGLELATTRCASATSPLSSRALNQQEATEERRTRGVGGGRVTTASQSRHIKRVSSATPLCLYESPGSSDDERDRPDKDGERGEVVEF